ncbi:FAR1-related sequence 5-like protein, partial [Tanacetum coccineum]
LNDLNKDIIQQENEVRLDGDDVLPDVADPNTVTEGTYYDTIDEALDMYMKYAEMAGFEVKKRGQRLTKSGAVQHKYLMCNKEGVPKGLFWESQEIPFESLVIPLESYEIPLESHVIPVESHEIPEESHVILLESHVILLFSQFESHEISMESQVIHIEIRISLESQMIHVESQVIRIESHVISLESHICKEIYNETDFKERFDKIVWNMFIEPLEFEEKWAQLIEDFGLQSHKWLKKMFNLREIWIPAYFIDSPLYGLMRTTSRSESENSFFKSFTSPGATLVSFMMSYESAMERQRYRQESLDFKTIDATPKCITQLDIELHAARVYTRTMFLIVQTEINEESHEIYMESQMIEVESQEIHFESHVISE